MSGPVYTGTLRTYKEVSKALHGSWTEEDDRRFDYVMHKCIILLTVSSRHPDAEGNPLPVYNVIYSRDRPFKFLMEDYCIRVGKKLETAQFIYHGRPVSATDTVNSVTTERGVSLTLSLWI